MFPGGIEIGKAIADELEGYVAVSSILPFNFKSTGGAIVSGSTPYRNL